MTKEELELLKSKIRKKYIIGTIIATIIGIVLMILTLNPALLIIIIVMSVIVLSLITSGDVEKYKTEFKNIYVLNALSKIFDNLDYKPNRGINASLIRNTKMMNMGDRFSSNDFLSGKYKNINVVQADVHIEERHTTTDSNGNTQTTWVTIFMGKWMIFDFNKSFKANLQVRQKSFSNATLNNWFSDDKYTKVLMEDQEFNKRFKVYAQNEHDAFYVLTPSLMERIKKICDNISGSLLFCFINNKLHVGLANNCDSFEPSIFKKTNEEEIMNSILHDIKIITDFIDELNLDNTLFRREVQ